MIDYFWTGSDHSGNPTPLEEAVQAIREDVDEGENFECCLAHYSELFAVNPDGLRHEWNLLQGDCR